MRSSCALVSLLILVLIGIVTAESPQYDVIPGRYIAVFKKGFTAQQRAHLMQEWPLQGKRAIVSTSDDFWDFSGFSGFVFGSDDAQIAINLESHPMIDYVEPDRYARTQKFSKQEESFCRVQRSTTWGLSRVTERNPVMEGKYNYERLGSGVDVYVIDTGISPSHLEFQNPPRVTWGANLIDDKDEDCNGHGTHVAGTIGGNKYGIAKNSTLFAVKVASCTGVSSVSAMIKGVEWSVSRASKRHRRSVINMSLATPHSDALNSAVKAAVDSGIVVVVAAGNDNLDACLWSPASSPEAFTVGATSISKVSDGLGEISPIYRDSRRPNSNFGSCVDIFAPGSDITSAWITSDSATVAISGTSMAAPHVAGVSALYLSANPNASPKQVKSAIKAKSTPDLIDLACDRVDPACRDSPNQILFSSC